MGGNVQRRVKERVVGARPERPVERTCARAQRNPDTDVLYPGRFLPGLPLPLPSGVSAALLELKG